MLIGHLGFAMGLKAWVGREAGSGRGGTRVGGDGPGFGLAPWFGAVLFADLACFALALLGIETFRFEPGFTRHFPYRLTYAPYTHSFLGAALLGVLVALAWVAVKKTAGSRSPRGKSSVRAAGLLVPAFALAVGVFSHAPLDWVVHGPDMAWALEPPALGLSLWNYPEVSETIEVLMLSAGTCLVLWAYPGLMHWRFKAVLAVLLVAEFVPSVAPPVSDPLVAALAGFSTVFGLVLLGWWGGRVPARSSS